MTPITQEPIAFIGGLGPLEIVIIVLLIVVLFGASRIPELARSVGEAQKEFKKASIEGEKEVQEYKDELEEDEEDTVAEDKE